MKWMLSWTRVFSWTRFSWTRMLSWMRMFSWTRLLSGAQRLPLRRLSPRRIGTFLFLGTLALLGFRSAPPPAAPPVPAAKGQNPVPTTMAGAFKEMRPRAGDHMAFPRIGFRWAFDGVKALGHSTTSASQASMVGTFLSVDSLSVVGRARQGARFLLHLVGPGGHPEIRQETTETQLRLNLRNEMPPGEYEWWVEAYLPGLPPVCSPKERFALTP